MASRRKPGLRSRIFLSYSVIVVLIVTLLTGGLSLYLRANWLEQEAGNLLHLVQKSALQADGSLQVMMETAVQVGVNPEVLELFTALSRGTSAPENRFETDFFDQSNRIYRALTGIKYQHYSTGRISLYDVHGNYISSGNLAVNRAVQRQALASGLVAELLRQQEALKGLVRILEPHKDYWSDRNREPLISVVWNITDLDTTKTYGVVEVQQEFGQLLRLVSAGDNSTRAFLLGEKGASLWNSDGQSAPVAWSAVGGDSGPATGSLRAAVTDPSGRNIPSTLVWSRLTKAPWTLVYVKTEAQILRPLDNTVAALIVAAVLLLGLSVGVVQLLSVRLSQPLQRLRHQLDRVDQHNLVVQLDAAADADVAYLNTAFADMFLRLRASGEQLAQARAHETQAQLLALQSQMDPHFLFNILSVFVAEARASKADRLVTMGTTLSNSLRYVSDYDTAHATLAAELSHVQGYLELMRFRYEEGLEFTLHRCEGDETILVPKLILQPVVENCFRHAFSDRDPPWRISLTTTVTDDRWSVTIEDNGAGLLEADRAEILDKVSRIVEDPSRSLETMKIGGLGLVNSFVRLQLRYGDQAQFELGLVPQGGTRIVLGGLRT